MSQASFPTSPRRARPVSSVVAIMATAIGFTLVFVLGVVLGVRGWDVAILGLAVMTGFVAMLPLLIDASRPPEKRQLLLTVIALGYLAFFVASVFTQYFWVEPTRYGIFDLHTHHPGDIVAAQVVALTGLICMIAGFHLPIGRSVSRAVPKLRPEWSHETVLFVAIVMIPIGWSVYLGRQFGLFPVRAGTGFLGFISMGMFYGIALLSFAFIRYRSARALLLLFLLIPPTMAFNFFQGSKRLVLLGPFIVAIAYTLIERRIRMSFVIVGVLLLVILYPVAQFQREVVQRGFTINAVQVLQDPRRAIAQISAFLSSLDAREYLTYGLQASGSRVNALGVATVIVRDTPSRVPYQGGWTIGYIFLSYIPRALWPGKPITTIGQWVTDNYGAGPQIRSNTGASWIGEFYLNFGYPGVIFGMLILGIWFRLLQEHFFRPDATIPALVIASAIVEQTARIVGGNLMGTINGPLITATSITFIHLVVQLLSPPPRRPLLVDGYANSSIPSDGSGAAPLRRNGGG